MAAATDDDDGAVAEEAAALLAIFAPDELCADGRSLTFTLASPPLRINVRLPPGYPREAEPELEVSGLPRGRGGARLEAALAAELARSRGAPCVFDLVQCARDVARGDGGSGDDVAAVAAAAEAAAAEDAALGAAPGALASTAAFVHGAPVVERKSLFIAHCVAVHSDAEVRAALSALLSEPRLARATHNIRAWRFTDAAGSLHADNDDDGEDAAGGRLAEMLQLMGADGVLIVVSRWFGGTLLGPSRFKVINNCARDLLESQPWAFASRRHGGESGGSSSRGGPGRR